MPDKQTYIWFNGQIIPSARAKIHILNHSLHYGSATFEGIRCYETAAGPAIFRLHDHIDRLFHSAAAIGIKIPYSKSVIVQAVKQLIKKNKIAECYIRPLIFYGEKMELSPTNAPVNAAIAVWSWEKYLNRDRVNVCIVKRIRLHPQSSEMTAKISGYYANSVSASLEAAQHGADEALLLDFKGNIAEGPGENIFFVKNKKIFTPPPTMILPGITRASIMLIARDLGYEVTEKSIAPAELKSFDEAFFTGTAVEISIIGKINNHEFSPKSAISRQIQKAYLAAVHGENKKYLSWLNYVG